MAREARPAVPRARKGWVFLACVSVVTSRRRAVARRPTLRSPTPCPTPLPAPATEVSFQGNWCLFGEVEWVAARAAAGGGSLCPTLLLELVEGVWLEAATGEFPSAGPGVRGGARGASGGAQVYPPRQPVYLLRGVGRVAAACLSGSCSYGWCFSDYKGLLCFVLSSTILRTLRARW